MGPSDRTLSCRSDRIGNEERLPVLATQRSWPHLQLLEELLRVLTSVEGRGGGSRRYLSPQYPNYKPW